MPRLGFFRFILFSAQWDSFRPAQPGRQPWRGLKTAGDFSAPKNAKINAALKDLPKQAPQTACADAQDLGHKGDKLHLDTKAQHEPGKRCAEEMRKLQASGR
jgi:hypothetical protein